MKKHSPFYFLLCFLISEEVSGFFPRAMHFSQSACRLPTLPVFSNHQSKIFSPAPDDILAAQALLHWEEIEASMKAPLLRLSHANGNLMISNFEAGESFSVEASHENQAWMDGSNWQHTRRGLFEIGIMETESFLCIAPQLLRLDSTTVLSCASYIIKEFGLSTILQEPLLLTFREDHICYGISFLENMMSSNRRGVRALVLLKPKLLVVGVEKGIDEKLVAAALGAAGSSQLSAQMAVARDVVEEARKIIKPPTNLP